MKSKKLSHISANGQPQMVDVSDKVATKRIAKAQAIVSVGKEILALLHNDELHTKKGPVFQTAIIAGVMGAKKTSELIPMCHALAMEDCQDHNAIRNQKIIIDTT